MQFPTLLASQDSIAHDPPGLRALCFFLGVLVAILPLAHVTALRNTLVGLVVGLAALQFPFALWKNIPGLVPWLVWLAYAAASIGWSELPDASFQSFRSDQFYPFAIFLVTFQTVQYLGGRLAVVIGIAAGALLCLATMVGATLLGADSEATAPHPGVWGWLAWKADEPADSSAYVAFSAVPLFLILVTSRHSWRRWAAASWLLVFAAIGFHSENRTLVAALFISFVGFLFVLGLLRGRLHWRSVVVVIAIGLTVSALCLEIISRARLPATPPGHSAAVEMIMSDPRPAIWASYLELARKRPWFGVGLGRTVPPRIYHLEDDAELRHIDSQASSHAHNVMLDLVLQVGLVGLAIWVGLHFAILRLAVRRALAAGGDREKAWAAAAVALVLAMLVKDSTNDLLVYGNAILFWGLLGAMLGLIWRGAPGPGDKKAGT